MIVPTDPQLANNFSIYNFPLICWSPEVLPESPQAQGEDTKAKYCHGQGLRPEHCDPDPFEKDSETDLHIIGERAEVGEELDGSRHALYRYHSARDDHDRKDGEKGEKEGLLKVLGQSPQEKPPAHAAEEEQSG